MIAAELIYEVERGRVQGYLGATTLTTIFYLSAKLGGRESALAQVEQLLRLFEVAPVTRAVLTEALELDFGDFEDAVLHEAGRRVGVEGIVTRDARGFRGASLRIYSPEELAAALDLDETFSSPGGG